MKNEEKADREWLRNNLNKDTRQGKKKKDIQEKRRRKEMDE